MNAGDIIQQTRKECQILKAKLGTVLFSEETMHIALHDGYSNELECHPEINLLLKIKLKDR